MKMPGKWNAIIIELSETVSFTFLLLQWVEKFKLISNPLLKNILKDIIKKEAVFIKFNEPQI